MSGLVSFGLTLLPLIAGVTCLTAISLLVGRLIRDRWPAWEDGLYRLTFLAMLMIPITQVAWRESGQGWLSNVEVRQIAQPHVSVAFEPEPLAIKDVWIDPPVQPVALVNTVAQPKRDPLFTSQNLFGISIAAALLGSFLLLARQLVGTGVVAYLLRRSEPLTDAQTGRIREFPGNELSLIRIGSFVRGPVVMGMLRPRIILPTGMLETESAATIEAVLMHELAHIDRMDPVVHAFARSITAVFWWHPLVRLLHMRLRQATEMACDRAVLKQMAPIEYAETLLELSQRYQNVGGLHLSLSMVSQPRSTGDSLATRIALVLKSSPGSSRALSRRQWCGLAVSILSVLLVLTVPVFRRAVVADEPAVTEDQAPQPGSVTGVVVDETGKPTVARVFVSTERDGLPIETSTDDRGRFRFSGLDQPHYEIWSLNEHGRTGTRHSVDDVYLNESGLQTKPVELKLKLGVPMQVRVQDVKGQPIEDAEIKTGWMQWEQVRPDGVGLTAPLTDEIWQIRARAPGHAEAVLDSQVSDQIVERVVTLVQGTTVNGFVRDMDGNPVASAMVWFASGQQRSDDVRSGRDGAFELQGVPLDATLKIMAQRSGYEFAAIIVNAATADPVENVRVSMVARRKVGVFRGRVLTHEGKPAADADVKLTSRAEYTHAVSIKTDSDGLFTATELYIDDSGYDVVIDAPGHALNNNGTKGLSPYEQTELATKEPYEIQLAEGQRFEAIILDHENQPMQGVSLRANYARRALATSDEQGRIELHNLAVDASISFSGNGFTGRQHMKPDFDNLPLRLVSSPPGLIRGRVVDDAGLPVKNFRVRVWFTSDPRPNDGNGGVSGVLSSGVNFSSPEGSFELKDMRTGSAYQVIVIAAGYRTQIVGRAEVIPSTRNEPVLFSLQRLGPEDTTVIAGQLLSADGSPMPGVSLRLLVGLPNQAPRLNWEDTFDDKPDRAGEIAQNLASKTDQDGRFRFNNVQTGGSIALFHQGGDVPATIHEGLEVKSRQAQAELRLRCQQGGKIQITVAPEFASDRILVDVASDGRERMRRSQRLTDGVWTIDHLPPGRYDVEVWPTSLNGGSEDYQVTVSAGETTTVRYPPGGPPVITMKSVSALKMIREFFGP